MVLKLSNIPLEYRLNFPIVAKQSHFGNDLITRGFLCLAQSLRSSVTVLEVKGAAAVSSR